LSEIDAVRFDYVWHISCYNLVESSREKKAKELHYRRGRIRAAFAQPNHIQSIARRLEIAGLAKSIFLVALYMISVNPLPISKWDRR
jgi:hypothetical protein